MVGLKRAGLPTWWPAHFHCFIFSFCCSHAEHKCDVQLKILFLFIMPCHSCLAMLCYFRVLRHLAAFSIFIMFAPSYPNRFSSATSCVFQGDFRASCCARQRFLHCSFALANSMFVVLQLLSQARPQFEILFAFSAARQLANEPTSLKCRTVCFLLCRVAFSFIHISLELQRIANWYLIVIRVVFDIYIYIFPQINYLPFVF